jgi:Helix-turn-helix domain
VNCPTTRCSTPAADPRTGPGSSAPPRQDPAAKTQSVPFAALPHELRKDLRLKGNRTAIVLAAALLEYARASDSCWPSNRRLAEDLGCCPQTIRNALAALQAAGWVRVEHGAGNPTGRVIWLTWRAQRATPPNRLDPPLKPAGESPLKPVGPEARIVVVEGQEESPKYARERLRREIPPAPVPTPVTMSPDPETPPAPLTIPSQSEPRFPEPAISLPPPPIPAPPAPRFTPSPTQALPSRTQAEAVPLVPGTPSARSSAIPTPGAASLPALALPLTPEQQARLAAMPLASRDQVLLWLATGDPILVAEARSKLAPPRPRPEAPTTLPELLGRIREDPSYPALAACELARALGDAKSYSGYLARCTAAWRGEIPAARLVGAYEQATGPKARNPGAIFMVAVRRKE